MKINTISEISIIGAYFAFLWIAFFSIILIPDMNYLFYLMALLIVITSFSVITTFKYWHLLTFSFLVSIFYFQNIPIGMFGEVDSSRIELQALIASKSIVLIGLAVISIIFIEKKKFSTIIKQRVIYFSILTITCFLVFFILSSHGMVAKIATLKNIIMTMVAVLFGFVYYIKNGYFIILDNHFFFY